MYYKKGDPFELYCQAWYAKRELKKQNCLKIMEYIMKNFNKNLLLVVALASIISSPVSAKEFSFVHKSIFGRMQDSVSNAVGTATYNTRYFFGLVSPIEEATRELKIVGNGIQIEVAKEYVSATAGFLSSFLPKSLQNRVNMQNLVIALTGVCIDGANKTGSAIKTGVSNVFGTKADESPVGVEKKFL